MQILGLTIARTKDYLALKTKASQLQSVDSQRGWWRIVSESFTGAWQQNVEVQLDNVLTHPTVFALSLIHI